MIAVATARVRCGGKMHRISLMTNGRLRFHDHDRSLWLRETLAIYAGSIAPECRCAAELRWWRTGKRWTGLYLDRTRGIKTPPKALKRERIKRIVDGKVRLLEVLQQASPRAKLATRTEKTAQTLLEEQTDYRRPSGKWAGGEVAVDVCVHPNYFPHIQTSVSTVWSGNGKWSGRNLQIRASLKPHWYLHVHRPGLAIVTDGDKRLFVLDVDPKWRHYDDAYRDTKLARVVRQGRGLGLQDAWALIHTTDRRVVRWLVDNQVAHVQA